MSKAGLKPAFAFLVKMSEILFEYVRQGQYIKVSAIEPETKTEVCVVVPVGLSEKEMQIQALKKLQYVLKKKEEE